MAGSQPFTWVTRVKISVCFTYQIYLFETFEFLYSCIRGRVSKVDTQGRLSNKGCAGMRVFARWRRRSCEKWHSFVGHGWSSGCLCAKVLLPFRVICYCGFCSLQCCKTDYKVCTSLVKCNAGKKPECRSNADNVPLLLQWQYRLQLMHLS